MGVHTKALTDFTFTGASTVSNAVSGFGDCEGLAIYYSSSTGTTFTVQVSLSPTSTSAFGDLQSAGADITITASEAIVISPIPFRQIRMLATGSSTGSLLTINGTFRI